MGWEGVGLCSYLLISFWFERNSAAVAGKKAFVTNRIGDFGFMLAMFLIFEKVGIARLRRRQRAPRRTSRRRRSPRSRCCCSSARSARARSSRCYVWLPDAMEGPTPVSALIHAATMVTAGVFLDRARATRSSTRPTTRARSSRGSARSPRCSRPRSRSTQNDIKKVLAYSTISQLGYMFLAVGVGAYSAAIFHMIVHAFFKALLFLGAGSVIHGVHDEQDMRRMGGLRKYMPFTVGHVHRRLARDRGRVPARRASGPRTRSSPKAFFCARLRALGGRARRRGAHRVLHDPPGVAGLLRRRALAAVGAHGRPTPTHGTAHERTPHESPCTMLIPLFVLAGSRTRRRRGRPAVRAQPHQPPRPLARADPARPRPRSRRRRSAPASCCRRSRS